MLYYLSKQAAGEKALADVVASLVPLQAALESKEGTGTVQERIKLDEVLQLTTCHNTIPRYYSAQYINSNSTATSSF
jgi:hypothetical protein